jgi:hypothetical protein
MSNCPEKSKVQGPKSKVLSVGGARPCIVLVPKLHLGTPFGVQAQLGHIIQRIHARLGNETGEDLGTREKIRELGVLGF